MSLLPKTAYSMTASGFHWLVAAPMLGTIGCVLKAQQSPKEEKGKWMFRHKSLGLLTGMIVAPRFAYRLFSRGSYSVQQLSGNAAYENSLGKISHYAL